MSFDELNALIELALRAPKSQAESIWLQKLVQALNEGQAANKQQQPVDAKDGQTPSSPQ